MMSHVFGILKKHIRNIISHYKSLLGFAALVRTAGFSCSDLACASQLDLSDAGFTVLQLRKAGAGKCALLGFLFRFFFLD